MYDLYGPDLWDELLADTEHWLHQWYNGEYWSNYVDAIIGITAQATPGDYPYSVSGVSSSHEKLDQGRVFVLLKWQIYWKDDNLVQHEVSHLYYADDHFCINYNHCVMAGWTSSAYPGHYIGFLYEDWLWWVGYHVACAYTTYSWCNTYNCYQVIQQNSGRYPLRTLTISTSSGGTTNPAPGTHIYGNGLSVTVSASPYSGYAFDYWLLDGTKFSNNPITVTMNSNHDLKAYFIKLVNLMVRIPQAPPEGVKVWVDSNEYRAYADVNVSVMVKTGQHTVEVEYSFIKEEWEPGAYYIYTFDEWSDGSTDNPRTVNLTSDTTLTAYYMRGKCGIESKDPLE